MMVIIAVAVGGYILAHENLKLPGWVPVLGRNYYTLKADFQTAQALTPGQGQAVTIAGAKIGEVSSVDLNEGVATVTMKITPKYARIYRNATMLMRPKTAAAGHHARGQPRHAIGGQAAQRRNGPALPDGSEHQLRRIPRRRSTRETRAYLQELAGGRRRRPQQQRQDLAATFKRFDPAAHYGQEIAKELAVRHANIARSIHNFRLLTEARRRQGQAARAARRRLQRRLRDVRQGGREPAEAR